jgi:cytoskeletal protein CcmA (bactofilin family)
MAVFKTQKEKLITDGPDKLNRIVDGAEIRGDISVVTSIRIDGVVTGNISCAAKLVLGESGKIVGNVISQSAEIEGVVEGELQIQDRLVLKNTARILGNIVTQSIVIEEGAVFDGVCKMNNALANNSGTIVSKTIAAETEDVVY